MSRLDFLKQRAPDNYVAGLGRGATGFTTRSDLGPARAGPSNEQIQEELAKRAAALGAATPTAYGVKEKKPEEDNDDDGRFQDPENETGLFANGFYDREDDEADRIYQDVDEKMERRRRGKRLVQLPSPFPFMSFKNNCVYETFLVTIDCQHIPFSTFREAREQAEREEYDRNNPKISAQFADLKRSLAVLSEDDWANLPDPGDLTGKNRRTKQNAKANQRFYAVPDSVLAGAREQGQMETSVQDDGMSEQKDGTFTNFADIGAAKNRQLQVKMDQAAMAGSATSGTSTSIDTKGYMTSLATSEFQASQVEMGDVKRVRTLMESVIKTNPKHAPGWIAIARVEEMAGHVVAARKLIAQGCEQCPKSEDAWMENIRLNESHNAKIIAANAIMNNNTSTRLWIEAVKLEQDERGKKNVLRKAIDHIPQSVAIWKEAVNLEEDMDNARKMLRKAVETIPLSVELWLALARLEAELESPEKAQGVLNAARRANPTSYEIWIAAARLQEQTGKGAKVVEGMVKKAISQLAKESAMLKREEWIGQAEKCEEEGSPATCAAIVYATLDWSLDEDDDRKEIFRDDAKASIGRGRYVTARAIYKHACAIFTNSRTLWLAAVDLERNHGSKETQWTLLEKAVNACPNSEVLWLQLAREKWDAGEKDKARLVLARAFDKNPNNEEIYLAAVKLEGDDGEVEKARALLKDAREQTPTERVWYKSAAYERQLGNIDTALDLVLQGLTSTPVNGRETRFPRSAKLWMMKGQIYEDKGMTTQAREAYLQGRKACPKSIPLWLLGARLEEKAGVIVRARSVLDQAKLQNPRNAELWLESIRIERKASPTNMQPAQILMAKAKQECPKSGILWAEDIWYLQKRTARKNAALEAIKQVDNDVTLFVTVARIFWGERKLEKAATWFEKAIGLDADVGDSWAWYLKFLTQYGEEAKRKDIVSRCVMVEPKHGEVWQRTRKDPRNAGLSIEEVLIRVADELQ